MTRRNEDASNGLGKTTIVTMFYYVLTRQWTRLLEFEFRRISLWVDGARVDIDPRLITYRGFDYQSSLFESMPPDIVDRLIRSPEFRLLMEHAPHEISSTAIMRIARNLEVPPKVVERALWTFLEQRGSKRKRRVSKALEEVEAKLSGFTSQVLYLPTYRRIEQDLKSLFPNFEGEFRKRVRARMESEGRARYIELVEFGMEDVEARVSAKIDALREASRVELNNLAGGYLRDVVRGEAREWSEDQIKQLGDNEVNLILGRVEEKHMDEQDKRKVFEVIDLIRKRKTLDWNQDLLAHFFSKLVSIHENQKRAEVPLRQFMDVCNGYLTAKQFRFDDVGYALTLDLDRGGDIKMRGLSSGEKQIVSLFAQLYLGDAESYCLIIDEPELSLSVEWQQRLLPDIINSGRCSLLVAVTHSPFIYENSLFAHAQDLAQLERHSS